eukprot:scaffold3236_cov66-Cylindrotheca_fusiformis.AAC.23
MAKKSKVSKKNGLTQSSSTASSTATTNKKNKAGGSQVPTTTSAFPPNLLLRSSAGKGRKQNGYQQHHFQLIALAPSAVFVVRNFMDSKECQAWIDYAENQIGFESMCNPPTREYAHRECGRISKTDWDMADRLYERMKPIVEEISQQVTITHTDATYGPRTCNGNLRLYRYEKNMSFGKHYDGSEKIARYPGGQTEITVLVYLSSCEGGGTRFYLPTESKKKKKSNAVGEGIVFVPEVGAILLHIHGDRCLEHEADPVLEGVKYVLRTDIVYAPDEPAT